jgi:hypothetical protein
MTLIESDPFNLTKASAFRLFKVVIFGVLMINLVYYMYEDMTAYLYLAAGSTLFDKFEAFAVTIDYVAWMVLIVLFEMETSVQSRDQFTEARKWVIAGLPAVCYAFLVYAAYGYVAALGDAYNYESIESRPACYFANTNFAYLSPTARPIELTHENCSAFAGKELFKSPTDNLIATEANLLALQTLSWVDVFNSCAWLLVVLLFQVEVSLEQMKKLTKRRFKIVMAWKGLAYLVLLGNAIYWTVFSAFIDYWDAWLWLIAFILIDLNMLGFEESQNQKASDRVIAG